MEINKIIEKWKKEYPKKFEEIERILRLCEKYETYKLQPIVYPQVQFKAFFLSL